MDITKDKDTEKATWSRVQVFVDNHERELIELTGVDDGKVTRMGGIVIQVKPPPNMKQLGPQQFRHQFTFPETYSIQECFDNFDNCAEKAVKEWDTERRRLAEEAQKQIITAPQLVGVGGQPLNRRQRRARK